MRSVASIASGVAAAALLTGAPAFAQSRTPVLAREQILIEGIALKPLPEHQTVPRNIATTVTASVVAGGDPTADTSAAVPSDAVVYAEMRGPAFGAPVTLTAHPGEPFRIQPLAIEGTYVVENIRLVSGGVTFLQGTPDTVTIDVIDKVLVSQVSTRPLTAKEIQQKGIFVDQTNFDVVNFTAAFGIQGSQKTIDFPIVLPKRPSASLPASPPAPSLPPLSPAAVLPPPQALPQLQQVFQTNNVSISGLVLRIEDDDIDRQFSIPPIPGVIIIPGNIAFLHQFFSVLLMVSNVAPGTSNLVVRDATATIVLPPGADKVPASDDDPLKMARTGNPPLEQSSTQPIVQAGPDGKFGTPDDLPTIAPGESGNSEFLVEGRKEGTHTVQIEIHAMLDGLPVGPVKISGYATGIVEVRNPTFSLTLSHPATVMAGDPYDLLVTVSNTSDTTANLVSVNLSPNSISGATLQSDQTVTLDTIGAHDAATATFHLISQQTGNVTATSFTSDDAPGKFVLRTSVGALGIPPSPNSLVLPPAANGLPADLKMAGISLLGQAFALATSPVVPAGLKPISSQIVYERATDLTEAGQRLQMGDTIGRVGPDLLLDILGNGLSRLTERFATDPVGLQQAQADYVGFDSLFRQSARGDSFLRALAAALLPAVQSQGALDFQRTWAAAAASRPPFISAITASSTGATPVVMRLVAPDGRQVGMSAPGGAIVREVPFANMLTFTGGPPGPSQLILDAAPDSGSYRIELNGTATGTFDLGIVTPAVDHLRRLVFTGVAMTVGARATLTFSLDGTGTDVLSIDDNGDGIIDRTLVPGATEAVADSGPTLVSAVQVVTGAPDPTQFGQVIGLLFSEEIQGASAEIADTAGAARQYQVDGNQVLGAAVQPGGRIVLVSLRDGVGPFVPRSITVSGIQDRAGHGMSPDPATVPIVTTISTNGASFAGQVRAADGTPIRNARLALSQKAPVAVPTGALAGLGDLSAEKEVTVTVKDLDSTGRFSFDYVRQFGSAGAFVRFQAVNLDTGETGEVITHIGLPGRHVDVDIVFIGTGTVAGRALASDGVSPLAGAVIKVSSLTRIGQAFAAVTDANGVFTIAGVPAGNFTIEAVHVPSNARTVQAGVIPRAGATIVQNLTLIPLADIVLKTGSLKGQVFHASDGSPAAGVPVYTDRGGLTTTDASGNYQIDTVPIGPVSIVSIDQARFEQASSVTTIVAGTTVTANLLLVGGSGTVHGVVVDATGRGVANAVVGGGIALVRTDSAGAFVLDDVPIGTRTISALDETTQATSSASITLVSAGDVANVRITLPGQGSVAGRVFESDGITPITAVKVFLLGGANLATVTDANGGYRFDRVPFGAYKVSAFKDGFADGNVADTKVTFQGEVRVTNIVARGKGRVTGVVFAADGVTPLGARVGFSEMTVATGTLAPPDNVQCLGDIEVGDSVIELPKCQTVAIGFAWTPLTRVVNNDVSSGTFSFDDVFVGGFTVEAANAFSPAIMRSAGAISHAGETASVVLKLQATSSVKGVVYQPDGITPAGKNVVLTFNSSTLSNVNVITDEHGAYIYPLVNPGPFSISASDPATGLVGRSDGTVDAGAVASVPVRLLATGRVKVVVTGSNGLISGASVTVARGTFPNDSRGGVTGSDGSITFSGGDALTEGAFSVSAFDPASGITGYASGTVAPGADTSVQVRLGDETGTVRGRFLMPDGVTPIPNAQVRLTSLRGDAFATTDTAGAFSFDGAFGNFTVEAFDPVTARRGRSTGAIAVNHDLVVADVIAIPQGVLTGVVRLSSDGSPVAAADVTLSVSSLFGGQLVSSTGVDGTFTFPGVSAGSLSVTAHDLVSGFSGSASAVLSFEGETATVAIVLQVPRLGRVQGTVRKADGSPAIGAQIALSSGARTTVDNAGFYAADAVPVGGVKVTASAPTGYDGGAASGELKFAGDVTTIDVTFIGTGVVSANVRSSAGAAVPFATVTLTSRDALQRVLSFTAVADGNGSVRFPGMPVGDISVTAVDVPSALAGSASGRIAGDSGALDLIVTLQSAGALRATVLRQDRTAPAAGLAVEVSGPAQRFGSTAADGTVTFDNLPLGQYQLLITDPLSTGIVKASASITQAGQLVDLGSLALDETPPSVQQIDPPNGTGGVPVTRAIRVTFSEPVDAATVTTETIRVSTPSGAVAGSWTLDSSGTVATFAAAAAYRDFTQVALKVTTAVTDRVGKPLAAEVTTTFTTADSTPPSVISRSPLPSARDVASNAVLRIAFSEAFDPTRFAGPALSLSTNGAPVDGRIDFALGNTVVIFTPAAPLLANTTYRVTVQPAADLFGNAQPGGFSYTFSTLDTIAPAIETLTSSSGVHVRAGATTTITAASSATDIALVELLVNGTVVQTRTTAPFAFSLPVTSALVPAFTAAVRATDLSGNVGDVRVLSFTVDPDLAPSVTITGPADGTIVQSGAHLVVSVHATDDNGVAQVGFQATGAANGTAAANIAPPATSTDVTFPIDVPFDAAGGSRIDLKAAAVDTAGQSSATVGISVVVRDATPPVVKFISPAAGSTVDAAQTLTVTLQADDAGGVASIGLQVAGAASFNETRMIAPAQPSAQASFQVAVPPTARPTDRITMTAVATDASGNVATNVTLAVTVRDLVPPTVALSIAGAPKQVQPGRTIVLSISATDDGGVATVGYEATGAFPAAATQTISPAQSPAAGQFALTIPQTTQIGAELAIVGIAVDASGNPGRSTAATVTIVADQPPTVHITAPAAGTHVTEGATLTLAADATDDVAVARVEFRLNGATVATSATPPYTTQQIVPKVGNGSTMLVEAIATDSAGQTTRDAITLTLDSDSTPPRVAAISPADQAADVSTATPIQVTFTEPLDPATVTTQSFRVSTAGVPVSGELTLTDGATAVRFSPAELLPLDSVVVVELTSAITDRFGNALADATGNRLTAPLMFTFATATFAITRPAPGADVIERTHITLEAQGSASLGIASVMFDVNGTSFAASGGPKYTADFPVPARTDAAVLTIRATARDGAGRQVASQQVTVNVQVGLQATPAILGIPVGDSRTVRLSVTSSLPTDLPISLEAVDSTVVSLPQTAIVLPAGQTSIVAAITGAAAGNTTVLARSDHGIAATVASVSVPVPQQTLSPLSWAAGLAVRMPPVSAQIAAPQSGSVGVTVRVAGAPVANDTAVVVTSSNESIARVTGTPIVRAGQQVAALTIATGASGTAMLTVTVGHEAMTILIVVGDASSPSLVAMAAPVGTAVRSGSSTGQLFTPISGREVVLLLLRSTGPTADTPVSVSSSNPAVVTVDGTPTVRAGQRVAAVTIVSGTAGTALLTFSVGNEVRVLEVTVGAAAPKSAAVVAPPVGASVAVPPSVGRLIAPLGVQQTIGLRLLSQPANADLPVVVTSSNPAVADVIIASNVPAGGQVSHVAIQTGSAGTATLTLRVGTEVCEITVVVGNANAPVPATIAPPVGLSLATLPQAAVVIAPIGSAVIVSARLLDAPAATDTVVSIASSNLAVASVQDPVVIHAGEQVAQLGVVTAAAGTAEMTVRVGNRSVRFTVISGTPSAGTVPIIVAPSVGVKVQQ